MAFKEVAMQKWRNEAFFDVVNLIDGCGGSEASTLPHIPSQAGEW
jgi:hypothetical protein